MAVTAYTSYIVPSSQVTTDRPAGVNLRFVCDTFAELPTGSATINGDTAYCIENFTRYVRSAGAWAVSYSNDSDPWTYTKLASDSTVSTTAFANVSGMNFSGLANTTYLVELLGAYQAAATTTGIGLALDVPASTEVVGVNIVATSATALGGTEQVADATTTGATTGVRAANTNTPILCRWIVRIAGTAGTVQLMQRSEVAASNTILKANLTALGRRII